MKEAKAPEGFKFRQHNPVDLEKVKNSKFYRAFVQRSRPEGITVSSQASNMYDSQFEVIFCSFLRFCVHERLVVASIGPVQHERRIRFSCIRGGKYDKRWAISERIC